MVLLVTALVFISGVARHLSVELPDIGLKYHKIRVQNICQHIHELTILIPALETSYCTFFLIKNTMQAAHDGYYTAVSGRQDSTHMISIRLSPLPAQCTYHGL